VQKPRIYIAIGTFHPQIGGAERQALLQAQALRVRGYDATIITLRHDRTWPKYEVVEGVPVVRVAGIVLGGRERLPAPLRKLAYLLGVLALGWALWRRRHSYDILHVYQLNLLTLPAAFVCGSVGKPLIVALRCADARHRASSRNFVTAIVHRWRTSMPRPMAEGRVRGQGDLEGLASLGKPGVQLTRYLLKRAQAVMVVLTSRMRQDLAAHGFPLAGVRLIPNGVDPARFCPGSPETSPTARARTVLCAGRVSYQKGLDVLLHAWRIVQERLPEPLRARLVIAGTGPLRARLESLAAALGIADSVEFVGAQSDMAAWLRRGDIAVLPSRWEGMSNALLEAMACGLPCVATRVSGSEDLIQHGVNGLLVEPDDYRALAEALLCLLRDPELCQRYGRAARATVEERYSLEQVMDVYLRLYHSLCSATSMPEAPAITKYGSAEAEIRG
jgi:glycosyltransferase involved in cell wall biosynthesis